MACLVSIQFYVAFLYIDLTVVVSSVFFFFFVNARLFFCGNWQHATNVVDGA